MELILWRHAEAEDGIPDSARELTDKGRKQADLMAAWLRPRLPKNTRIIVSPTQRTQQTASALDKDFETIREIGPGVSPKTVLNATGWPDAKGAVLVVGHQPTLGEVAALLMSGDPAQWTVRKGSVWWFAQKKGNHNFGELLLQAVVSPDTLQAGDR